MILVSMRFTTFGAGFSAMRFSFLYWSLITFLTSGLSSTRSRATSGVTTASTCTGTSTIISVVTLRR